MKQMVTAEGSTVGLPDLRAGSLLEIAGVGARLGGRYFVTGTTHAFSDQGYVTRFKARREHDGSRR
jgi:phage protein D